MTDRPERAARAAATGPAREMTLAEWVDTLPVPHSARREFEQLRRAAALREPSPDSGQWEPTVFTYSCGCREWIERPDPDEEVQFAPFYNGERCGQHIYPAKFAGRFEMGGDPPDTDEKLRVRSDSHGVSHADPEHVMKAALAMRKDGDPPDTESRSSTGIRADTIPGAVDAGAAGRVRVESDERHSVATPATSGHDAGPVLDRAARTPHSAAPRQQDVADGERGAACHDCGEPYSSPRFQDLVVPHDVWNNVLSPYGDEGGLLCPNCMNARAVTAGIECEAKFTSGPFAAPRPVETGGDEPVALLFETTEEHAARNYKEAMAREDYRAAAYWNGRLDGLRMGKREAGASRPSTVEDDERERAAEAVDVLQQAQQTLDGWISVPTGVAMSVHDLICEAIKMLGGTPVARDGDSATVEDGGERERELLQRIRDWDMLDTAADGAYWKREIDATLSARSPAAQPAAGEPENGPHTYE